jgi:hypothetical protein
VRKNRSGFLLALMTGLLHGIGIRCAAAETESSYTIAFASFGPGIGDGYTAALINYGFLANAVLTTDEAVKALR